MAAERFRSRSMGKMDSWCDSILCEVKEVIWVIFHGEVEILSVKDMETPIL